MKKSKKILNLKIENIKVKNIKYNNKLILLSKFFLKYYNNTILNN